MPAPDPASAPPPLFVDVSDFEREAKARMPHVSWEYISGAAADELTLRWNRESYDRLRLRPRAMVDVSKLDTRVTLLGREHPFPLLLAPTAYQRLTHPEGDLATARGAHAAGVTMVASIFSSDPIEAIAAAAPQPLWMQLYIQRDRDLTRELVRRAEASGCEALVLTVDTPVLGPRNRELRSRFSLPPGVDRANLRGLPNALGAHRSTEGAIFSALLDPSLTWKDVAWLRSITKLPLLVKGVLNPDDAVRAIDAGVAGIIVSNHGARNLDTEPATIDALPEVAAKVAGRVPILVDGGVRRGTDILKAIALGANAVLIGRPYLFGLAVDGAAGVTRVIQIIRRELEMAMAVSGRPKIADIDASLIWR
ncbi:MAG TPA: alpha-hydroxy acid oxidase [Opitutaceae bacterium]|nr:alpha-hydroxy acid oxidase [Opitutaceae bacterium]